MPDRLLFAIGVFDEMSKTCAANVNSHVKPDMPDHPDRTVSTSMSGAGTVKLRIVTGLFDGPASLTPALQELLTQGFVKDNICVSGALETVSKAGSLIHKNQDCDPLIVSLLIHTEFFDISEPLQTVVGSQGKLFTRLNDLIKKHQSDTIGTVDDECSEFTAQFHSHIKQGSLVLMVETEQPRQLTHASRILLRHSSNTIQTHEFRPVPNS